jgi:hypothetical protein
MSLIISFVCGLLCTSLVVAWMRRRSATEVESHTCRCPGCGQKLRYSSAKAGGTSGCPNCRRSLTLPSTTQPGKSHASTDRSYSSRGGNAPWHAARILKLAVQTH